MVSQTTPFPQLIAGFKSQSHVSPWLWPRGLYPQWGSYPCRPTCCPSYPSYLLPRLLRPLRILLSPSRSTVVSLVALVGWLVGWLVGSLVGSLVGMVVNPMFGDSDDRFNDATEDSDDGFDDSSCPLLLGRSSYKYPARHSHVLRGK